MIKKDENGTTVIEMGTGDICVSSGFMDDPNINHGLVSFTTQKPKPIGEMADWEKNQDCSKVWDNEAHTRLVFTDSRSIDVVIEHLQKAKKFMADDELLTTDI